MIGITCGITACQRGEQSIDFERERLAGFNDFRNSQFDDSLKHYEQALTALNRSGADSKKDLRFVVTLNDIARVHAAKGDFAGAKKIYSDALQRAASMPDNAAERCDATEGLAYASAQTGDVENAERCFAEALQLAKKEKLKRQLGTVVVEYARFLRSRGAFANARELEESIKTDRNAVAPLPARKEQLRYEFDQHFLQAKGALYRHEVRAAYLEYLNAWALVQQLGDAKAEADTLTMLGLTTYQLHLWQEAREWFSKAVARYDKAHVDAGAKHDALSGLASAAFKLGDLEQAEDAARKLVVVCDGMKSANGSESRQALAMLAEIENAAGQRSAALEHMRKICDGERKYSAACAPSAVVALSNLANQYYLLGKPGEGKKLLENFATEASHQDDESREVASRLLNDYAAARMLNDESAARTATHTKDGGSASECLAFVQAAGRIASQIPGPTSKELERSRDLQAKIKRSQGELPRQNRP